MEKFSIRQATRSDLKEIAYLTAEFRVTLKALRGVEARPDISAAQAELEEYLAAGYPVYAAVTAGGQYTGYIVCRVEEPCVWAESIYVCPEKRRCGIASALFEKAEELARSYGEETVYNYVHPNNDKMIGFLASNGYNVLNLIEIRKPYNGEKLHTKMQVGGNSFDY